MKESEQNSGTQPQATTRILGGKQHGNRNSKQYTRPNATFGTPLRLFRGGQVKVVENKKYTISKFAQLFCQKRLTKNGIVL